jgi:peptidoglycan/LPS O-acetylase OafA/YrhL
VNKSTSFYLDFLRVIAAFGVLLVHVGLPWFSNNLFFGEELGHKLVMIFFVLSGYLIAFTVNKKNKGSKRYLVDRFSRLYSVVLPALIFTYLLDFIGKHFNPALYSTQVVPDHQIFRFILNAAYLQQIWSLCTKPSSNGPFWSISYEFWYYMLFWVFCYFNGAKRYIGLACMCLFVGVKILLLFPVWIFGVLAYNYSNRLVISVKAAILLFVSTFIIIFVLSFVWDFSLFTNKFIFGHPPLFFSSQFFFDWIYGTLIALNLFSLTFISSKISIPPLFNNSIKYLSSITFSLYLFHFPMLVFIAGVVPYNKSSYLQIIPILIGIVFIVSLLAIITEKQRDHWKSFFGKVFHSLAE